MNRLAAPGNATLEYSLIGLLAAGVCLIGLSLMGGNLNTVLAALEGDMNSQTPIAASADPVVTGPTGATSKPVGTEGFRLSDGTVLQLPAGWSNIRGQVETTGGNGGTLLMASTIASLAQQMLDSGKIDQKQYNLLSDLANQGHRLAGIEETLFKLIEQTFGDLDELDDFTYYFDGSFQKGPGYLLDLFGDGFSLNSSGMYDYESPENKKLLQLYEQAQKAGALDDPAVDMLVATLVNTINNLSDRVDDRFDDFIEDGGGTVADLEDSIIETSIRYTEKSSNTICSLGGETSSCTKKSSSGDDDDDACQRRHAPLLPRAYPGHGRARRRRPRPDRTWRARPSRQDRRRSPARSQPARTHPPRRRPGPRLPCSSRSARPSRGSCPAATASTG